jgi:NNP family nitrate/nitrite transporter-like MFS transporter
MALAAGLVLVASRQQSLPLFCVGFIVLFVLSGLGNGSTYRMIPAIFARKAPEQESRGRANAVIGIAGAVGAAGGVLINIAFRQSFLTDGTGDAAYLGFMAFYAVCVCLTWLVYLRAASRRGLAGV